MVVIKPVYMPMPSLISTCTKGARQLVVQLALEMMFAARSTEMGSMVDILGVGVILRLESTARVLIPHWEEALPPEARSRWSPGAPPSSSTVAPTDLEAARAVHTPRHTTPKTAS